MGSRLRYTGKNPSIEVLATYPNWTNAYDEEGLEGQDETTLKPENVQTQITDETTFTAGDIEFADARTLPVLISVTFGEVTGFHVYADPESPYLSYDEKWSMWSIWSQGDPAELDRAERWWKSQHFPARVTSRLPLSTSGAQWEVVLDQDGMVVE